MSQSPILETLASMKVKLESAIEVRRDAERQISDYSTAIRALALVCEDDEVKITYLNLLEELGGKPGFLAAIRTILRAHRGEAQTPGMIRAGIRVLKLMDLSTYSNPLASIHTTLKRMKDKGEVEETLNAKGEKVYRLKSASQNSVAAHDYADWERIGTPSETVTALADAQKRVKRS
jgi:hypothetical protein